MEIYIKDKDKFLSEYSILKKIAQGTFGVLVLAIYNKNKQKSLNKSFRKRKNNRKNRY